jgi:hypothetical protein
MDNLAIPGSVGIGLVFGSLWLLTIAWYVGVIVLLVKIWNKVKNIPT